MPKRQKSKLDKGEKRKAETSLEKGDAAAEAQEGTTTSTSQPSQLQEALQQRGPNTLDGVPVKGSSGTNECPVPECSSWRT